MKKKILISLVCASIFFITSGQELANFRRTPVVSPEIGEKNVTFRIRAPQAKLVRIYGSWMRSYDSSVNMNKDTAGLWVVTIAKPAPELYTYKLLLYC